jgi:NADH-quinone oxidoreductase subunit E
MDKRDVKSHFVGVRMTEKENKLLAKAQEKSKLTKTEVLLKGLDLMSDYYSLGLDEHSLSVELKELEEQARRHTQSLKQVRTRASALKDMVGELRAIDEVVDRYGCKPNNLIQILLAIQKEHRWLPRHALMWVSERLQIPIARIYQIANFYEAFSLEPRGKHLIQVCMGTACYVRGAPQLLSKIEEVAGIRPDETDAQMNFSLQTVNCLGCCALAPVVKVDNNYYCNPSTDEFKKILNDCLEGEK